MKHLRPASQQYSAVQDVFVEVFTDAEGEDEGQLIGDLVQRLLNDVPAVDLRVFATTNGDRIMAAVLFSRLQLPDQRTGFSVVSNGGCHPVSGSGHRPAIDQVWT